MEIFRKNKKYFYSVNKLKNEEKKRNYHGTETKEIIFIEAGNS